MKIYKYIIDVVDIQTLVTNPIIKILDLQIQWGEVCFWAIIDETKTISKKYSILTFTTGEELPAYINILHIQYVGTYQLNSANGTFVGHVYIREE